MSKGKHTPGPWTRGPKPENGMPLIVAPESNRVVLGYKEPNYDEEGWYVVDDYDLQLMLTAPDLLAALEELVTLKLARDIGFAYSPGDGLDIDGPEYHRRKGPAWAAARAALAKARGES